MEGCANGLSTGHVDGWEKVSRKIMILDVSKDLLMVKKQGYCRVFSSSCSISIELLLLLTIFIVIMKVNINNIDIN